MTTVAHSAETTQLIEELYGPTAQVQAAQHEARQAWRQAVSEVAEDAHAALPDSTGRIAKAVALVLNGDVELLPDGKAQVASQADGGTEYLVVNGTCPCKDFPRAPQGQCKHRIARGIQTRATALVQARLEALPVVATTEASPVAAARSTEAPFSLTLKGTMGGHDALLTARGDTWEEFAANIARLRGLLDAPAASSPAAAPVEEETQVCPLHDAPMKRQSNDRGWWYSHALENGTWCKGKAQRNR